MSDIIIDQEEFEMFRKFNNQYERKTRRSNLRRISDRMPREEIMNILRQNQQELVNATIEQMVRFPEYFSNETDFQSMDAPANIKVRDGLTLIAKATHACNLTCPYCYDHKYRKGLDVPGNKMSLETIKNALNIFRPQGIKQWIWHGGEPLLMGIHFYEEANKLIWSVDPNIDICIQTNGTLINEEWVNLFKSYRINPSVSFDGLNNCNTRKNTGRIVEVYNLLEKNNLSHGGIQVLDSNSIKNIIQEYEFTKRLGVTGKMNLIFGAEGNEDSYTINGQLIADHICNFFDYWIKDRNKPHRSDLLFNYLGPALGGNGLCTTTDCAKGGHWFALQPDGTILQCGRDWPDGFSFGNINEISSINQIFENETYLGWLESTRKILEKCSTCDFFYACHSGCFRDVLHYDPNFESPQPSECYATRKIISHMMKRLGEIKMEELADFNYLFVNFLFEHGYRGPDVIEKAMEALTKRVELRQESQPEILQFIKKEKQPLSVS